MSCTKRMCLLAAMVVGYFFGTQTVFAHGGTSNDLEREVCNDASLGDYCQFTDHHERVHRGTCRSFDEVLMCVRNQPFDSEPEEAPEETGHMDTGSEHTHEATDTSGLNTPALALALGIGTVAVGFFTLRKKGTTK